ncbi:hypothetical protein VTK56DRAFT_4970 [Thermocarpiscus australiensis]
MGLWEEEDYGVLADWACWAMFAATVVIVGPGEGRWAGRRRLHHGFLPRRVLGVVSCILVSLGSRYGLGRHFETLPPEHVVPALR